jgi:hypothetical protein
VVLLFRVRGTKHFGLGTLKLKSLITDKIFMVEVKGVDPVPVPNLIDIALASNEKWMVPVGIKGRRFAVNMADPRYGKDYCPDATRRKYFKALGAEMDGGGIEAMMWDLLRRPIGEWDPEAFPVTDALLAQKQRSLRSFDKVVEGWAQIGVLPRYRNTGHPALDWDGRPDCATMMSMMRRVQEIDEYETDAAFKLYLKDLGTEDWRVPGGPGNHGAKFPPLPEFRASLAQRFGGKWNWDLSVEKWRAG